MDEAMRRDRLIAAVDEWYFAPVLNIDPQTVPPGERDAFVLLQEGVRDSREWIRSRESGEDLVHAFEQDWHSDEGVETRRGLARLGHPVPNRRDRFLVLARELGVPNDPTIPPVVTGAPEAERLIRERAQRLWEADGQPRGREDEYLERARELEGIVENPRAALLPNPMAKPEDRPSTEQPVEEASVAVEGQPDVPGFMTDQGERPPEPSRHAEKQAR